LACCCSHLAAALLLFLHPGAGGVVLACLLAGIGFGAPAGVIGRLAEDAAPDAPNSALGLIFTGFAAGASSGSLLGAAVGGAAAWLVVGVAAVGRSRRRLHPAPARPPRPANPAKLIRRMQLKCSNGCGGALFRALFAEVRHRLRR